MLAQRRASITIEQWRRLVGGPHLQHSGRHDHAPLLRNEVSDIREQEVLARDALGEGHLDGRPAYPLERAILLRGPSARSGRNMRAALSPGRIRPGEQIGEAIVHARNTEIRLALKRAPNVVDLVVAALEVPV